MKKSLIPLFDLNFDNQEEDAVLSVLRSKWITMGPKVELLEKEFSKVIGNSQAVAVSNCTVALHMAILLSNVNPGDEVIVPSLTFVATVNAVLMRGAVPIFADVTSLEDWTISVEDVKQLITPRTKAVIAMHYAGYGADVNTLREFCDSNKISLIEDACHAPLGRREHTLLGSVGDFSCYSFYGNKTIAVGEGGVLGVRNPELVKQAKLLRSHGMTSNSLERFKGGPFYDVTQFGYNYRLDDIHAALALVQLEKLPTEITKRKLVVERYRQLLNGHDLITLPFIDYKGVEGHYIFPIFIKHLNRDQIAARMREKGVQVSFHYPPAHLFSCYEPWRRSLPITELIGEGALTLPLYGSLSISDVDYVCKSLLECLI